MYMSNRIKTIPNYNKFFIPIIKSSEIKLAEVNNNIFERNGLIKRDKTDRFVLLMREHEETTSFSDFFYNTEIINDKKYITSLLQIFKDTLKILILLEKNKIIHQNICPETIIIRSGKNAVLTNYEQSFYLPELNDERKSILFLNYNSENYYKPLDLHVLQYIYKNKIKSLSLQNIEEICEGWSRSLSFILNDKKREYKEASILSLQKYINKPFFTISNEIIRQCFYWDFYSFQMCYLILLKNIRESKLFHGINVKIIESFYNLLFCNIFLVQFKRLEKDKLLEALDSLISTQLSQIEIRPNPSNLNEILD